MIGSARSPRPHESAVPGWCTSRPHATMPSNALARERRPLASSPGGGRHSPPKAGGGKDPEFRGGSPLGRNRGVQRHPDGCVVHAFPCASRSGADPHRQNWPEVGVPVPARHLDCWGSHAGLHFHSNWPAFPGRRLMRAVSDEPPAPLRGAVPAGGRRSKPSPRFLPLGDVRFAPLRGAVPTRGRRSKPSPRFLPLGDVRFAPLRGAVPTGGRRSKPSPRFTRGGVLPSAKN